MVQDGLVDGRRSREHGDALFGDPGHHRRNVEHRVGDVGSPGHEAGQDARVEAKGVEIRVDDQVAVAGSQADHLAPRLEAPADGGVDEHGTFGQAGGARGEHDVAKIVAASPRRPGRRRRPRHTRSARSRKSGKAGSALGDGTPQHHDLVEAAGRRRRLEAGPRSRCPRSR